MKELLAFFGGILFLSIVIFAVYLILTIRQLNATATKLFVLLQPLIGDKSLVDTMRSIQGLVTMVPKLGMELTKLSSVFTVFNNVMLKERTAGGLDPAFDPTVTPSSLSDIERQAREVVAGKEPAAVAAELANEGKFYNYEEGQAALNEEQEELRKQGIETNDANAPQVPLAQHKTE